MKKNSPPLLDTVLLSCALAVCASCAHYGGGLGPAAALVPGVRVEAGATSAAGDSAAGWRTNGTEILSLSLKEALFMAFQNNPSFRAERLNAASVRTAEAVKRSPFDPVITAAVETGRLREKTESGAPAANTSAETSSFSAEARLREFLATGTALEVTAESSESGKPTGTSDNSAARWEIKVTQALLRGRGSAVNLAELRQAEIDRRIALCELRAAAEALAAQVEQTYWDCVLAERSMVIYERSLEIAEREIEEVKERIRVGRTAETELAAAEAEAASRREQLIEAAGVLARLRLAALRLVSRPDDLAAWSRKLALKDAPELPSVELGDVEAHVRHALANRHDLSAARLRVERGNLEVVRTRNGLLPKLDFFCTLGGSGYSESFRDGPDSTKDDVSYATGLQFEVPLGVREAAARRDNALISLEKVKAALLNMEQLVQVDVRSAYLDAQQAAERVNASRATRQHRERMLQNEIEKFRVGRSTMFLVSQARRDMVVSQITEMAAVVGYRKALLNLHRLDGSLLARHGIEVE